MSFDNFYDAGDKVSHPFLRGYRRPVIITIAYFYHQLHHCPLSEDHKDTLQSHTFLNIPISNLLLGNRTGVTSILTGSLLILLRHQIATDHGVPDDLVQIVRHGERPGLDEITVATTRVPVFGAYMKDPINGYRSLGRLSSIEVQLQSPSTEIQVHRELLAVVGSGLAVAENFANVWAPSGLTMKSYVIVIFDWVSSFPESPLSVHPVRRIPITDWLRGLEDVSTDSDRENSPVSEIDAVFRSSSNSPVPVIGQAASSQDMPVLEPGTSIETICHRFQITDDQIRSARFQMAAKPLLRMVLNCKSMSHILQQLGLQERDAPFVPLQTVTLPRDLIVSAGEVVKHFGWNVESFKRQTAWYEWAERAASSQEWNGPPPK